MFVTFIPALNRPSLDLEAQSWSRSAEICKQRDASLFSDWEYLDVEEMQVIEEMVANNVTDVWSGNYFLPWVWLKGTFFIFAVTECIHSPPPAAAGTTTT